MSAQPPDEKISHPEYLSSVCNLQFLHALLLNLHIFCFKSAKYFCQQNWEDFKISDGWVEVDQSVGKILRAAK